MDPITKSSLWFYNMLEAEVAYLWRVIPIKLKIFWCDVQLFWISVQIGWMRG